MKGLSSDASPRHSHGSSNQQAQVTKITDESAEAETTIKLKSAEG